MLKLNWTNVTITTNKQANAMVNLFNELKPKVGGFDTETTGLNIILDTPFFFQFGFIDNDLKNGYTFAVDIQKQPKLAKAVIKAWNKLAEELEIYLAHNIKFDLNMLINYGEPYTKENVSDTQFYIRLANDALTPANGGPPLGLKDYTARYIDRSAKTHEKLLSAEKTAITKQLHCQLKQRLAGLKYNDKNYTLGTLKDIFKDPIVDYTDLPEDAKRVYLQWLHEDVPLYLQPKVHGLIDSSQIRYDTLDRKLLTKYAHYDIVYLLEVYLQTAPIVKARGNAEALKMENDIIYPLLEMERVGFFIDKEYLEESRVRMKNYIKERRKRLQELAREQYTIGQHAKIKQTLNYMDVYINSTNATELDLILSDLKRSNDNPNAIEFIEVLQELRTLEKWYSAYIIRFQKDLWNTDRIYTQINQVGAVSGRVTSDFQQFPKAAITTKDGEELFAPRRMVKVTGGDYIGIVYLDYSQIELRLQALYTILVGHPDTNLCRAYMPYNCVNAQGVLFNYKNPDHIHNWNGEWFYKENPKEHWVATDVHGATTTAAFGITKEDPTFHDLRYIGKRVNFAKNYGAQRGKIREMFPDRTEEEIDRINDAYYKAFPGVKVYHEYCYNRAEQCSSTANLFGVRYYGLSGHKLINCLVQGSGAYFLKWKIRQNYLYMKKYNIKSRFQMNIHDELSWEVHKDDNPKIFFELQKIMQTWDEGYIPVVADMEVTTTTWKDKVEVESIEELQTNLSTRPKW